MTDQNRLDASCRIALAAYLHDLGKFAERARIPEAQEKADGNGNSRVELDKQNYCPHFDGHYTHVHAAYTAIGFDLIEQHLPDLVGADMNPFAAWKARDADDSLINAAARHHKPETFLQWVIATANRLASGFERETFDNYNKSPDEDKTRKLNHYTTRQWTLLEHIRLTQRTETYDWRYPLKPLSPKSIFPIKADGYEYGGKDKDAQREYLELWQGFVEALGQIPEKHRDNLPLWLDHFDSLWLAYTHAIPSATAGIGGHVRPDVALYDHSRTTAALAAALAVALWRYHADQHHDPAEIREQLRAQWDKERQDREMSKTAWEDKKFLLIQGDFFGIQDFIFATGGETQKRAAKLLLGRSFYVSLLTELAALRILEDLGLPPTSQVVNAAGKFLIVAPNTPQTLQQLDSIQAEFDQWFLDNTYGTSGIGLAFLPACCKDFRAGKADEPSPFAQLMKRLFEQLEAAKLKRFDLCAKPPEQAVFADFLSQFNETDRECKIDGLSPASTEKDGVKMSQLAADQIDIGSWLATQERLLVTQRSLRHNALGLDIFGYSVNFTDDQDKTGKFGQEAKTGNLRRAWDFSLPKSEAAVLWNGYARRQINAYVPRFNETDLIEAGRGKYDGLDQDDRQNETAENLKTLNHLALDDCQNHEDRWIGEEALMTLKGDVDNLGQIFQTGLERPTFAKMAALSRQTNAFFAVYLPWLCEQGEEPGKQGVKPYRNTYTVFAGGDDFFLIGPWHSTILLAQRMKTEFARYVAHNPDIHFSAGLRMTKPGLPIRQLARLAEHALDAAKSHNPEPLKPAPKNAVTAFGQSVAWANFEDLMVCESKLAELANEAELSGGYLYALLTFVDMAEKLKQYGKDEKRPVSIENALWPSQFAYRTRRFVETCHKKVDDPKQRETLRQALHTRLIETIADQGIKTHEAAYKIALFKYLYQQRQ